MTSRAATLRVTLVAPAALAGLLAMHGLTHHGEHLPSAHGPVHQVSMAAAPAGVDSAHPMAHSGAKAAATCLSMLLAGGLSLAAVRRRRAAGLLLRLPLTVRDGSRRPPVSRAHDPPAPWSLPVCRC